MRTSAVAGTAAYSASDPGIVTPRVRSVAPRHCGPLDQSTIRPEITRSPTVQPRTPAPRAAIVPAPSVPGIAGNVPGPNRPSATARSRWLSDAACSRSSTSPGPGSGVGTVVACRLSMEAAVRL